MTARAALPEDTVESTKTMIKHVGRMVMAGALSATAWACGASAPTQELVDARRAYQRAQVSPATEYTPDDLLTARQALDRAEAAHKDDPGSAAEAHLAYLAARRAQIATARGEIAESQAMAEQAQASYRSRLERTAESSQNQLAKTQGELKDARQAQSTAEAQAQRAEQRAAAALQSLSQIANVREEQRGMVITLSGAVLFPSGGDELSPAAKLSLDRVAEALQQQKAEAPIVIEGHTDSRGGTEMNERLSQERAQAVATYLASRGLDAARIQAVGRGESEPIASNDTTDGRASNRRVEIIVGGESSTQGATFGAMPKPTPTTGGAAARTLPEGAPPQPGMQQPGMQQQPRSQQPALQQPSQQPSQQPRSQQPGAQPRTQQPSPTTAPAD
jgi:outer membrane protein OmpA-like peptidoglycan-associated protein